MEVSSKLKLRYLCKMCGKPQFSFWISIITLAKIFFSRSDKPRKNTFELVVTVQKKSSFWGHLEADAQNVCAEAKGGQRFRSQLRIAYNLVIIVIIWTQSSSWLRRELQYINDQLWITGNWDTYLLKKLLRGNVEFILKRRNHVLSFGNL